jgi:FMN phosphatase YigB (HAD superfamily)
LARRLFPHDRDLQEAFLLWRGKAKGETLAEHYAPIDPAFPAYAGMTATEMTEAEKEDEAAMLTVNPSVRRLIQQHRAEGCRIAFISDMYLDSAFLRKVLEREGCAQPEDAVYVSCEHGVRKDVGTLYDVVRRDLHPDHWIHYGDHPRSDVKMARRKGITARQVHTEMNAVERATLQPTPLDTAQLVALSRLHRLQHEGDRFAAFAADFVAPAYLPYVFFVLNEARRTGIRKLYFLSRDSYVLYKAAQEVRAWYPDIELHYLFVSRRSLLLPYLYGQGKEAYLAASDHHTLVRIDTVDKRLKHLGTSREELQRDYGITFAYKKVNNLREQEDFLQKIFASGYTPVLQERAARQHALLMQYFEQEGILDGSDCAAVDVGWLGTSRLMMNSILRSEGKKEMMSYYYGIRGDVFPPSAGRYASYFKVNELSTEATTLLEHYYSASPYPTTVGYREDVSGQIVPCFPEGEDFAHTPITQANEEAMVSMARVTAEEGWHEDTRCLWAWAKRSIAVIMEGQVEMDLTPLMKASEFDGEPFVRRLSVMEVVRLVLLGKNITAFDLASFRLSVTGCLRGPLWRLRHLTGKIRVMLYRKFIQR